MRNKEWVRMEVSCRRDWHVILSLNTAPAFKMLGALEIYVASTGTELYEAEAQLATVSLLCSVN